MYLIFSSNYSKIKVDRTELFKEENSKEELWKKSEGIKQWNIIKINILKEEWDNFITGNNDIFWK